MAEESQMKIDSMKKVYAEMILNTSKEAAARVMVAERKALRFQKELGCLKDESLHMLLRLKNNFNSQIQEAEARSSNKQMKIDELEAQLCEAEGIIVDLRYELNQVYEKLETVRHNQKVALNEHFPVRDKPVDECLLQDNALNSSTASHISDMNVKVASVHPTAAHYQSGHMIHSYNLSVISNLGQSNDDFSSIIMENRETDLCRNGCTQRIRALGRNLSNVNLPTLQADKDESLLNIQSETNVEEAGNRRQHPVTEKAYIMSNLVRNYEEPCTACPSKIDKRSVMKTPNELKGQFWRFSSCNKDQGVKSLRRSAIKTSRYREAIASLRSKPRRKYVRLRKQPFPNQLKACSSGAKVQSVETTIEVVEKEHMKEKTNFCCASDDLSPKSKIRNSCNNVLAGGDLKDVVCAEEADGADSREVDELMQSELVDVPILEGFDTFGRQVVNDNPLNFTFKRKRRKNVLSKLDENIVPDKNFVKRRLEKQSDISVTESNRSKDKVHVDNQRTMQVAHQLISLAGKGY